MPRRSKDARRKKARRRAVESRADVLRRVRAAFTEGDYRAVIQILTPWLKRNPDDLVLQIKRLNVMELMALSLDDEVRQRPMLQRVERKYRVLIRRFPQNPILRVDLGDCLAYQDREEDALAHFDEAIALLQTGHRFRSTSGEMIEALESKANALAVLGKSRRAAEIATRIRRLKARSSHLR